MNSSLFYLYWWTYCNMHDVNKYRVLSFPMPEREEVIKEKDKIDHFTYKLWTALMQNYDPSQHHEFDMPKVKPIIDEIEEFIGELYDLSDAEVRFLQSYHSEFGRKSV